MYNFAIMLKYFAAFLLILLASIFITSQHEKHAKDSASPAATSGETTIAANDSKQSERDSKHTEWYSPSRELAYTIIGFPNGITVWALFLTMMVVAEQTRETRRSADVSAKVFISTFRPRVVLRSVRLEHVTLEGTSEPEWYFELLFVNIGGTKASLDPSKLKFEWVDATGALSLGEEQIDVQAISLAPGEHRPIRIRFPNQLENAVNLLNTKPGRPQIAFPVLSGSVVCADETGSKRTTGFYRISSAQGASFLPSKNPESEYQD